MKLQWSVDIETGTFSYLIHKNWFKCKNTGSEHVPLNYAKLEINLNRYNQVAFNVLI